MSIRHPVRVSLIVRLARRSWSVALAVLVLVGGAMEATAAPPDWRRGHPSVEGRERAFGSDRANERAMRRAERGQRMQQMEMRRERAQRVPAQPMRPPEPAPMPSAVPYAPQSDPVREGRPGRLTPDERRALRQQINDAGRDVYRPGRP